MTVYRKKMKGGKLSTYYYYDFEYKKERFSGSTKKTTEREAEQFEDDVRERERQRYEAGLAAKSKILLNEACQKALDKPTTKREKRSEDQANKYRSAWSDFESFMKDKFKGVKYLHEVTHNHAETYINYIRDHGRYNKVVKLPSGRTYTVKGLMAPRTLNRHHEKCRYVFEVLQIDTGMAINPFKTVVKLEVKEGRDTTEKETFTPAELETIEANFSQDPWCEHIYYVVSGTGMREGNVCLLQWEDIDMQRRGIMCENLKSGGKLEIPILPGLFEYLEKQRPKTSGYVSPKHAKDYKKSQSKVSQRFVKYLNYCGIETTVKKEGQVRAGNIKGIHAFRHTFICRALIAKIPINIIQSIVGHVDEKITKHYANHVTLEDMHKLMHDFTIKGNSDNSEDVNRILHKLTKLDKNNLLKVEKFINGL